MIGQWRIQAIKANGEVGRRPLGADQFRYQTGTDFVAMSDLWGFLMSLEFSNQASCRQNRFPMQGL